MLKKIWRQHVKFAKSSKPTTSALISAAPHARVEIVESLKSCTFEKSALTTAEFRDYLARVVRTLMFKVRDVTSRRNLLKNRILITGITD